MKETRRLFLVKFESVIPVLADDREEALDTAEQYLESEIFDLGRVSSKTAEPKKRTQLSPELSQRIPVNCEIEGLTCKDIVREIERQKELDEKYQLKLFE